MHRCTVHNGCSPSTNRLRSSGIPGTALLQFPWLPNISCSQWALCLPKDRLPKRTQQFEMFHLPIVQFHVEAYKMVQAYKMFPLKLQVGLQKKGIPGYQLYTDIPGSTKPWLWCLSSNALAPESPNLRQETLRIRGHRRPKESWWPVNPRMRTAVGARIMVKPCLQWCS